MIQKNYDSKLYDSYMLKIYHKKHMINKVYDPRIFEQSSKKLYNFTL